MINNITKYNKKELYNNIINNENLLKQANSIYDNDGDILKLIENAFICNQEQKEYFLEHFESESEIEFNM